MTIQDALLIFWRTITAVACQAQTSIITEFQAQDFQEDAMQNWLKELFDAREHAKLTFQQCLQLQHEQLIMEQLGISERKSTFERCTLSTLSKMIFDFEEKQPRKCQKNLFDDDLLKSFAYNYYLLSASHNSDLYLNVAFGLIQTWAECTFHLEQ